MGPKKVDCLYAAGANNNFKWGRVIHGLSRKFFTTYNEKNVTFIRPTKKADKYPSRNTTQFITTLVTAQSQFARPRSIIYKHIF